MSLWRQLVRGVRALSNRAAVVAPREQHADFVGLRDRFLRTHGLSRLVARLEVAAVELEMLGGLLPKIGIPAVGQKDTADVQKEGGNGGNHGWILARSGRQSKV